MLTLCFISLLHAGTLQELVIARQGAVDAARSPLVGLQYRLCPFSKAAREYNQNLKAVHE
jgi:hypothetical protein